MILEGNDVGKVCYRKNTEKNNNLDAFIKKKGHF